MTEARACLRQAQEKFRGLDADEAAAVTAELGALAGPPGPRPQPGRDEPGTTNPDS